LKSIVDIWDPGYKCICDGEIVSFGGNDAIRNTYRIVKDTVFFDFSAYLSLVTTVFRKEHPSERSLTSSFLLDFSKNVYKIGEDGIAILTEIIDATSADKGFSKMLGSIAAGTATGTDFLTSKKSHYKMATTAELRDFGGPSCNVVDSSIDEKMRAIMMDFCKHVAWQYLLHIVRGREHHYCLFAAGKTRPTIFYTFMVKRALELLQEYRASDLCTTGHLRRAIQLGTLDLPVSHLSFMGDDLPDFCGLNLAGEDVLVEHQKTLFYEGTGEVPQNVVVPIQRSQDLPVLIFKRPSRHTKVIDRDVRLNDLAQFETGSEGGGL